MSSATKCYNWALINDKLWYFCCLGEDCEPMDTEVAIVGHVWRRHMRPQTPHQSVADTQPPTPVMSVHSSEDVLDVKIVSNEVPIEVWLDDEEEGDRDQSADSQSVTECSPTDEMAVGESVVTDTDVSDESSTGGSFDIMTDEEDDEDSDRNVYYEWDCERQVNGRSAVASGQSDAPSHHVLDETFVSTHVSIDMVPEEEEDSGDQSVDNESVARRLEIDDQSGGHSVPAATVAPTNQTDTIDDQWIGAKVGHKCPHNGCDYETLNRIGLYNHMRCDHPIDGRLYRCHRRDCDAVYTTRWQLRRHVVSHGFDHIPDAHHNETNDGNREAFDSKTIGSANCVGPPAADTSTKSSVGGKQWYKCAHNDCDYKTTNRQRLGAHKRFQHSKRNRQQYRCDREGCGAAYVSAEHLNQHQEYHRCGYTFDDMPGVHPVNGVCNRDNIEKYHKIIVDPSRGHKWFQCAVNECPFWTYKPVAMRDHIHGRHVCPNRTNLSGNGRSRATSRVPTVGTIGYINGDIEGAVELAPNLDQELTQQFVMRNGGQTRGSTVVPMGGQPMDGPNETNDGNREAIDCNLSMD